MSNCTSTPSSLLLCYVAHHDDAYNWAERRKIERHPTTGAAQLVEVRERVQEVIVPTYVDSKRPDASKPVAKPPLFTRLKDEELLAYGVPAEWLTDVRHATEDTILDVAERLPSEASEALLLLATGGTPQPAVTMPPGADPFAHPDAQRRFRVMTNAEELTAALDYPWEKWTVFLHPAQRDIIERNYKGPARVAGSAGTGKTIVALHRAACLARKHPDARVLLTTFSDPLATALKDRLAILVGQEKSVHDRITVQSIDAVGASLYARQFGQPKLADEQTLRRLLSDASTSIGRHSFADRFLWTEWNDVVDAWQLKTWEQYRDVARLGRKTRLTEKRRQLLWQIFSRVRDQLTAAGLTTMPAVFARVTDSLIVVQASKPASSVGQTSRSSVGQTFLSVPSPRAGDVLIPPSGLGDTLTPKPYDFAVVDEAQDISVSQLRFLAALAGIQPNGLLFTGDLGQRIFQTPFSWKSLGVDIRGRSHVLRINYRTSHQIRRQADRLLPTVVSDVDGNPEDRSRTISVFNGPDPTIKIESSESNETAAVATWLKRLQSDGIHPHEIGVFVRSANEFPRARRAVEAASMRWREFDTDGDPSNKVVIGAMHVAKGLEFKVVVVMACDDQIIPSQQRIESVADEADLMEVYESERHLLYVAATRARDHLLITATTPGSEFLADLNTPSTT